MMPRLHSRVIAAFVMTSLLGTVSISHADSSPKDPPGELVKEIATSIEANTKPSIRVLSYNIHHGAGMDDAVNLARIAEVIRSANPDIVALQEVDNNISRSGKVDQAAELGRLSGMHHVFGKAIGLEGGEYGIAILSKFPVQSIDRIELPNEQGGEQRVLLTAKLNPGGGLPAFVFADTHLEWQENTELAAQIRIDQASTVRDYLKDRAPYILAGDMNSLPDTDPLQILKSDAEDATSSIGMTHEEDGKIDYILFDKKSGWNLVRSEAIPEDTASDHYPVLSVLEWAEPEVKQPAGTVDPAGIVMRGEFIARLVHALGLKAHHTSNFADADPLATYYEALGVAKELGITTGVGGNHFKPNEVISRQDMMVLIARALSALGTVTLNENISALNHFTDSNQLAPYAAKGVSTLAAEGIIDNGETILNPTGSVRWSEVDMILDRINHLGK